MINFNNNFSLKALLPLVLVSTLSSTAYSEESKNPILSKNGVVAYTWNSNPSAENANLGISRYTFNYGRSVTRNRPSVGMYQVKFQGLSCERGQFIVNAYGGSEYKSCRIGSWSGKENCVVSVYCFDSAGKHFDSQFNLVFID